jgi:predicted MFS family arabinose efflux permease
MTQVQFDRSYRALFELPSITRLLIGMQIARIAQEMVSITIVLFTLSSYHSATLAGMATFFVTFPGLLVSPIAGALLDRHGRTRLVVLDYLVALGSLILIGTLALAGDLPAWLLMLIAAVASLTAPLSSTGLRSIFPLIIPSHLWERVNAMDSTGFVIATILGPPLAASIVALWGGSIAFIIIGSLFGIAAIVIARAPDPPAQTTLNRPLLIEAWQGLIYTWRNPTLRGLGFSLSVLNLVGGIFTIVVPLIILERLGFSETVVGLVVAIQGLTGMISAIVFGRMDSLNRERTMLAVPMVGMGLAVGILLLRSDISALILVMGIAGFLNGPLDVALFTLRQRRTDPRWTGRAFAVSMSFNYLGIPIGAAVAGIVAARSIDAAIAFGATMCLISGIIAVRTIPSTE